MRSRRRPSYNPSMSLSSNFSRKRPATRSIDGEKLHATLAEWLAAATSGARMAFANEVAYRSLRAS